MPDPLNFDGVQFGPTTDYPQLLREQLKYGSVWDGGDSGPHEGARRVIDAAEGTPVEGRLLDALVQLITDQDIGVRTGAVRLAWDYADKVNATALLSALNDHPTLFRGVKPEGLPESYMPDLAWGLIQAMNANPKPNAEVIGQLRQASVDPSNGFRVLGGLAANDPVWVIEHARTLASKQPTRARIILANLRSPQRREQFVRALADEPADFRKELSGVIQDKVQTPAERDRLSAILDSPGH